MFKTGSEKPKPVDTPFRQRSLPWAIGCNFLLAVVSLLFGAWILVVSCQASEYKVRYAGDTSSCNNPPAGVRCEEWVSITLTADMQPPVYMYYGLDNFCQNHRRMFKSRSDTQLSGGQVAIGDIDDCTPVRYAGDLQNTGSAGNSITNLYAPCGLIAWTMFNDSFTVYVTDPSSNCSTDPTQCGSPICVGYLKAFPIPADVPTNPACTDTESHATPWWDSASYVVRKFKTPYSNSDGTTYIQSFEGIPAFYNNEGPSNTTALIEGHALPVQTDQDFMMWMQEATLPTFHKLYRTFPSYTGFKKGSVVWIRIYNRFPVSSFGGKKYIVLSTTTWLGGEKYFLGIVQVLVACTSFSLVFLSIVWVRERPQLHRRHPPLQTTDECNTNAGSNAF